MPLLNRMLLNHSSVKNICYSFIASHLILILMLTVTFPVIHSQINSKAFDLQTFGYDVAKAESIVNSLNEQTTNLYLFPQILLLDLAYPFLLAVFLSLTLFRLGGTEGRIEQMLLLVPMLGMVFDYLENICIILMITKSLPISTTIVQLSSTFTVLKGVFTSIAWTTILIYSSKWLLLKIQTRNISKARVNTNL